MPRKCGRLSVIGTGVMAEAIVRGILESGTMAPTNVVTFDVNPKRTAHFMEAFGTQGCDSIEDCVAGADVVLMAVKPQNMATVCKELAPVLDPSSTLVTMAAGVPMGTLMSSIPQAQSVIRIMPNTPASIKQGITVWTASEGVTSEMRGIVKELLLCIGQEVYVEDEHFLDMATAMTGSGPAYVFIMMEAMVEAGVHMGFPRAMAEKLVAQTMSGSVQYAIQSDVPVSRLRNEITSPGGTTASALYSLERGNFRTNVSDAIWTAYRRSLELGNKESNVGPGRSSVRHLPSFWQKNMRDESY